MKRIVFKLGVADSRAVKRVLEFEKNGTAEFVEVPASERSISIDAYDGEEIDWATFYDVAEDGSQSRSLTVFQKYIVSEFPPLAVGSCIFSDVVDVDPAPEVAVETTPVVTSEPVPVVDETVTEVTEATTAEPEPETAVEPVSEAESIRNYLRENPSASNAKVVEDLAYQGIQVTSSQVTKGRKQVSG